MENSLIYFYDEDLIKELNSRGYDVTLKTIKADNDEILVILERICRTLYGNGYIDKEKAKKILSDYLDLWMTHSF